MLASSVAAAAAAAAVAAPADDLYERIAERLALMRDVAAHKWLNDLPIEDPAREQVVIESAVADGLRRQIRPGTSERFFRAQIEAAKAVQRYWFDRWAAGGEPATPPDLVTEIRPRLLELGEAILERLAEPDLHHERARFARIVTVEGLSGDELTALFDALVDVRRFPDRLAQILQTGVLRVGTTGDYAPFSFSADGQSYTGVDIDLAHDLARALGVELRLVRTSWPTLSQDLAAGRFDVAMSGVSRTLARARLGHLSVPYYVGGKMPIARCEDKRRFGSLEDIDRPEVRVIVNPGGTNEAFVDGRLNQAQKVLHEDNRTIFAALATGAADVMITDSIEVALQARKNPALCGTMGRPLTYQEKGYLMPKDAALKTFVDTWLELRLGDGTVSALLERHLVSP